MELSCKQMTPTLTSSYQAEPSSNSENTWRKMKSRRNKWSKLKLNQHSEARSNYMKLSETRRSHIKLTSKMNQCEANSAHCEHTASTVNTDWTHWITKWSAIKPIRNKLTSEENYLNQLKHMLKKARGGPKATKSILDTKTASWNRLEASETKWTQAKLK